MTRPDAAVSVSVHREMPDHADPDAAAGAEDGLDLERWRVLAEEALRTEGVVDGELSLIFVGPATMAELNVRHMGGTGPTDVLAFPIDGEDIEQAAALGLPILLGDVVVCADVARENAARQGVAVDDELALLVVHGVLHVLGHDHVGVDDTVAMKAREQALLAAHHRS